MHRHCTCWLIYYLLVLVIITLSFASEKDQENKIKCELGAFLEDSDGANPFLIDSGAMISTVNFTSCEGNAEDCAKIVEEQAISGTDKGNFTLVVDERNGYTVADVLCDKADAVEENVRNKVVHIYWRICESSWKPTSFKMPKLLCCEDGLYTPCERLKSEL